MEFIGKKTQTLTYQKILINDHKYKRNFFLQTVNNYKSKLINQLVSLGL